MSPQCLVPRSLKILHIVKNLRLLMFSDFCDFRISSLDSTKCAESVDLADSP
jgi:hypothetical protein